MLLADPYALKKSRTPSKNRVWNFFGTSAHFTGDLSSKTQCSQWEKPESATTTASEHSYFALYEAYGTRPYEWGDDPDRQKANTKEEETDLGLLNEGMRYRDLITGTWLSGDPTGFEDGANRYCYVHCNPITQFDAYGLKTFFVTGTFNDNGERFEFSTEAIQSYMESIGDTSGDYEIITWSGGNNEDARTEAAATLSESVDNFRSENPDEPANVVGYSHGGNVVIESANNGTKFDTSVTVATPVRDDYQPDDPSSMGNWYNVYSNIDGVQVVGGEWQKAGIAGRKYDEKQNPNVTNVKVSQSAADIAATAASPLVKGVKEHIDMQNKKGPAALANHVQQTQAPAKEEAAKEEKKEEVVTPDPED